MQRHFALQPFSRRHQAFLFYSRELKWRAQAIRDGRTQHFQDAIYEFVHFHGTHAEGHYRAETQVLIPLLEKNGGGGHPSIARTLAAQDELRALAEELAGTRDPSPDRIEHVAAVLYGHTMDQEHHLFPHAEAVLNEDQLDELTDLLDDYVV